jgi:head-tail adaptor
MLPAEELTQIRLDIETCLPDTCNILSLTRTSDGMGGWSETWGTTYSTVTCRLDFTSGAENVTAGALVPYTRAVVSLPQSTVITAQNRIEHGGNTYTVQAVNLGSWLGVKRASVEKI